MSFPPGTIENPPGAGAGAARALDTLPRCPRRTARQEPATCSRNACKIKGIGALLEKLSPGSAPLSAPKSH